jgi:hypothetical protein
MGIKSKLFSCASSLSHKIIARTSGRCRQYAAISSGGIIIKAVETASEVAASGAMAQAARFPESGWPRRGLIMCCPFCNPDPLTA